jgi:hypothetical protein
MANLRRPVQVQLDRGHSSREGERPVGRAVQEVRLTLRVGLLESAGLMTR